MAKTKTITACITAALMVVMTHAASRASAADKDALVVFLVRHAEKADTSRDPELSQEGKSRAQQLARLLRDAKIQHVHSSDFVRTRDTAKPVLDQLKLKLKLYDPRDLKTLVQRLKKTGGRHLIVGHSNTTPAMAKLLGGEPGAAIVEASEYDRLYCVTISASGNVSTVVLRYGAAAQAK